MKKAIKKYLTQLHENEEKGFSLVELIIVMAIMAILVGVVASQVIPYMEKSRQSKDQQQLSSLATNVVSAVAQSGQDVAPFATVALNDFDTNAATSAFAPTLAELAGESNVAAYNATLLTKLKSKEGKKAGSNDIVVSMDSKGVVTVQNQKSSVDKMKVETE
ncbi:MAG: type II secretion system GspH family protein [Lachnospiraceae bacterium]|nr:type II secretion system GspH family protein [Lachnospiraceae bacterium]